MKRLAFLPLVFLLGCSTASLLSGLKTADTIGRGVAQVLGWCESNGASPVDVLAAVEKVRAGDSAEALRLTALMVNELRKQGAIPPESTAAVMQLAVELQAAKSFEQFARAMGGRNPDGSPK